MYESLRQLILASQSADADAVFSAMDLAFAIDLCKEEGGGQVKQMKLVSLLSLKHRKTIQIGRDQERETPTHIHTQRPSKRWRERYECMES